MRGRAPAATRLRLEDLCSGPGKLTEALGVGLALNGADLLDSPFQISPRPSSWNGREVVTGPRIGITKAAELPWRYCAEGSRYVSRPWPPMRGRATARPV